MNRASTRAPRATDLPFLARSAAQALRWKILAPAWLWALLASPVLARAGWLAGGLLLAASGLLLWGLAACHVHWEHRTGRSPSIQDLARSLGRAGPDILLAPLGTLSAAALFLVLAAFGSMVALIPSVGTALVILWLATGGLALGLLGAWWLVVALAALPLQVSGAASGCGRTRMEIVAESIGKIRRAPVRYALGCAVVVGCAAIAEAVIAIGISIAVVLWQPGTLANLISIPDLWAPWLAPPAGAPPGLVLAARVPAAIFISTAFAGSVRLDLLLEED